MGAPGLLHPIKRSCRPTPRGTPCAGGAALAVPLPSRPRTTPPAGPQASAPPRKGFRGRRNHPGSQPMGCASAPARARGGGHRASTPRRTGNFRGWTSPTPWLSAWRAGMDEGVCVRRPAGGPGHGGQAVRSHPSHPSHPNHAAWVQAQPPQPPRPCQPRRLGASGGIGFCGAVGDAPSPGCCCSACCARGRCARCFILCCT